MPSQTAVISMRSPSTESPFLRVLALRALAFAAIAILGCGFDSAGSPGASADDAAPQDAAQLPDVVNEDGAKSDGSEADGSGPGPAPGCLDDGECEAGEICACTGACVTPVGSPCTKPINCGTGTWCSPCTGHCETMSALCEPCEGQGSCVDQGACLPFASGGSYCGSPCVTHAGCPTGFVCFAVEGITTSQCTPLSGVCDELGLCEDDGDCPDGEICNDTLKQCGEGCVEDGQCIAGQVCVLGRCTAPCTTTADCLPPAECEANGHCLIPGACESSAACDPEQHCDKVTGMCVPGCLVDNDCQDVALVCKAGSCIPKGCLHNYQCSFEEECDAASGQCIPMTDAHCAPCDASASDPPAACGGDPNLCVTLSDEEGTEKGDYCLLTCTNDPIDKCPQGYGCQHIEAEDGSIDNWYCIRSCWVSPVP